MLTGETGQNRKRRRCDGAVLGDVMATLYGAVLGDVMATLYGAVLGDVMATLYGAVLGDVMATLYLDNQLVGQTGWKPCNQSCWDQRFTMELERVRTVCQYSKRCYSVCI